MKLSDKLITYSDDFKRYFVEEYLLGKLPRVIFKEAGFDIEVKNITFKAFNRRGYKKGSRSIKMVLDQEENIAYSRKRIQRIMRKSDIVCPIRKANPYRRMMKATHEHTVVSNMLNRQFKQEVPGKILFIDITYL